MQSVEVMAVRGFCIRRLVGLGQRASEAIERPAERTARPRSTPSQQLAPLLQFRCRRLRVQR